jgi:hypothetical protein
VRGRDSGQARESEHGANHGTQLRDLRASRGVGGGGSAGGGGAARVGRAVGAAGAQSVQPEGRCRTNDGGK